MVAEQGGLSLLRSCGARLKIGQRGGLDEGLVTSPAFGNKRKWILFAHTEENASSLHTSWPCQAPGRHGSTSALTSRMAGPVSALSLGTTEHRGHRRDLRASCEWNSLPRCPRPHTPTREHREKLRPRLHLFKVTQDVTDEAKSRARPPLIEEGRAIEKGRGASLPSPLLAAQGIWSFPQGSGGPGHGPG